MSAAKPTIEAAAMRPGTLYLADRVNAPKPARARRGRPMRELLAANFSTLTDREKMRVYRHQGGAR